MLNQVTLIGRLGKDPEIRFTGSGTAVGKFSLATSENWTDNDGKKQERVEWHNIVVWRKLAENCGKYLEKGRLVTVLGRIQYRSYDDKDGNRRYITEIVAHNVIFMPDGSNSPKGGGGGKRRSDDGDPEWPDEPAGGGYGGGGSHDDDDDIPF